jgi:hypothetical protein
MDPTPMSHDFWLVLAAFVLFLLAGLGLPYYGPGATPAPWPWGRMNLLAWGAALIALALLWR